MDRPHKCKFSDTECFGYRFGMCSNLHGNNTKKLENVKTYAAITFVCSGCRKNIFDISIVFKFGNYYEFCFDCCIYYCNAQKKIQFLLMNMNLYWKTVKLKK